MTSPDERVQATGEQMTGDQQFSPQPSAPRLRTDSMRDSMTVFSTVGFGDITAKTDPARVIVTAQMFFDLILLGFGARAFLSAVQPGRQRRTPHQPQ